jgi:hypothetical protein
MQNVDFQQLIASPVLAYQEGLNFFMGEGIINETLRRVANDLDNHAIDYDVIGAIALNQHGYRRFTEDIDLLMTREGLEKFQNELVGLGYRPAFEGATKKFRTTQENVTVEIITSGEFPGDGKPKPVVFPNPNENQIKIDGIKTCIGNDRTASSERFGRRAGNYQNKELNIRFCRKT